MLIVLTSLCAEGTPRLALELCRTWMRAGIEPIVITLRSEPLDLLPDFEELGVTNICLEIPERGKRRYFQMAHQVYQLSKRFSPTAVLSMPVGWHAFMAYGARLAGVTNFAAHVGNYPPHWTGKAFRKFRWEVQTGRPVTSKLICCSKYVQEGVVSHFKIPLSETVMIYNGCPVENVSSRALETRFDKCTQPFTLGMVARLEQHKDQPTLIRAARLLKERGRSFAVRLIGEGSRRQEFEKLIKQEGVEDVVHLLGMRRDIPELLGQMDAFIFSTTPDEGLGIALIEAMAAGLPVIASDVGACRDVLDKGELGLLVSPGNSDELALAIERLMDDPASARARAEKARAKAFRDFTHDRMASEYARCLELTSRN